MLRKSLSLFVLVALCVPACAVDIVHDPGLAVQQQANHAVDFVKWAQTEAHEAKIQIDAALTQINTLKSYEQLALQVVRLGNPAALLSLPGVRDVAELAGTGQQLYQEFGSLKNYFNPAAYQSDLNSVLSAYSQPNWQGFTTLSGYSVPPARSLYQFDTARWNTANQVSTMLNDLQQQRQNLQQQRDQALRALQSSTTDAEVKKYTGIIAGLNAAIAEVDQRSNQAAHQAQLQEQKIFAGQQISQAATAERQAAAQYQAIDQELKELPTADLHRPVNWGNP
jgi:DNA repair exonuclease SbcCD ATPase subunit